MSRIPKDEQPKAAPSSMPVPQPKVEAQSVEVKMPQLIKHEATLFDPAEEVMKQREKDRAQSAESVELIKAYDEDKPLQVVALRDGFYKRVRRSEGDKFTIECKRHLGSWMKPILK